MLPSENVLAYLRAVAHHCVRLRLSATRCMDCIAAWAALSTQEREVAGRMSREIFGEFYTQEGV